MWEAVGIVQPRRIDLLGETEVRQAAAALLKFPYHPELVPDPVFLHGLKGDCVLELRGSVVRGASPQPLLLHIDDGPVSSTHGNDLSDFGHGRGRNHNFSHAKRP